MQFRNEKQVLRSMLQHASTNGLLSLDDTLIEEIVNGEHTGNQYVLDLDTHAFTSASLESLAGEIYNDIDLDSAVGAGLDCLGKLVGVSRRSGVPALVGITVGTPVALESAVGIPAGTALILDDLYSRYEYVTSEEVTLAAGTTSVTGSAESVDHVYQTALPEGMVRGLTGYSTLTCTNTESGSHGRDIETDEEYRERIREALKVKQRGTEENLKSYLDSYAGLDGYCLVPLYDGVGSLLIVCDCSESLLDTIAADVHSNCLELTDLTPVCELPDSTTLASLTLTVTRSGGTLTDDELTQLIREQVRVFIDGGSRRNGVGYQGLSIGEDFVPSLLVRYLFDELPELVNIVPSSMSSVSVPDTDKFVLESLSVVIA